MPSVLQRPHRPARRAALVATASVLAALAVAPATAGGTPLPAAPLPVVTTEPAPQRVSAAPEVRVGVSSPVASVVAPVVAPAGERWEVVGAAATARLLAAGVDPTSVGYTVDFLPGRSGLRGLTIPSQRRIEMYVRADHDVDDVLRVLVHELGHAVSETCLDGADRARYDDVRGLRSGWYPAALGGASGTEDHAEVFAWSVLGGLPDMKPTGGGTPGAAELSVLRSEGLLSTC